MSKWGQVGIILSVILGIACVGLGVMYYQENAQKVSLENRLGETLEEKKVLELNISKKDRTITQLNESMKEMQTEFSLKIEEKDTQLANLDRELKEVIEERDAIESDFSELKNLRTVLEKRINQVKVERDNLKEHLANLEKQNTSLLARLNELGEEETQLTLKEIVVEENPAWQGEVLAVDNEFGYAVISLGMKRGLYQDVLLGIFRGEENIAQARVLKIYENTSVVKLINQKEEVLENDIVKSIK